MHAAPLQRCTAKLHSYYLPQGWSIAQSFSKPQVWVSSLSQRTKDFRLYKQIFFCTSASKVRGEANDFVHTWHLPHRDWSCFYLHSSLLTQTLMLQNVKQHQGIKMLSGHINWIAQVFISPSISGLPLPSTSFCPEGSKDVVECAAFKLQIPDN